MRTRRRHRLFITGILLVGAAGLALAASPGYELVVMHEDGHVMWRVPVRVGMTVVLAYTNSIYGAPTEEVLQITPEGFVLTEVRSTSEAVLAYNALPHPYRHAGGYVAAPAHTVLPASLPLRIGQTGRQRLLIGGRTLPLFEAGTGARVTIEIAQSPLAARWAWR